MFIFVKNLFFIVIRTIDIKLIMYSSDVDLRHNYMLVEDNFEVHLQEVNKFMGTVFRYILFTSVKQNSYNSD